MQVQMPARANAPANAYPTRPPPERWPAHICLHAWAAGRSWRGPDLNRRPPGHEPVALPAALPRSEGGPADRSSDGVERERNGQPDRCGTCVKQNPRYRYGD